MKNKLKLKYHLKIIWVIINDKMNNPIEIASFIKENFNDNENKFIDIKVMGPYVNFYIDYDKFNKQVIKEIETNDKFGSLNQGKGEKLYFQNSNIT